MDPSDPSDVSIGNPTQNWVRYTKGIELSPPAQLRSVVFASKRPGQVDQVRHDGGDCEGKMFGIVGKSCPESTYT